MRPGSQSAGLRRICLQEMGYARFLAGIKYDTIDRRRNLELIRVNWRRGEEPLCLIKVKCPSAGVFYALRVPPDIKTVPEAVAWTFDLSDREYRPEERN